MITMTTIGYGDISAEDTISRVVLIVYLPTAVAALADTLTQLTQISTAKMLIETDFTEQADDLLLGEAGGANPNPEETLTEAEFLISVLKDNDLIDDMSVQAIRLQFAQLVRHDTWTSDPTNRVLDDRIVFLEMKAQGRIAQSGKANAPATTEKGKNIEYVDLKAADGGFKEWLESYWLPRVFDGKSHGEQVRLHVPPAPGKAPSGAAPTKTMKDPETGGKKSYQQLKDSNGHPNKGGAYFGDGAASSVEGEYVWMPKEEARKIRKAAQNNDRDLGLWLLLGAFTVYFVWKILPHVIAFHFFGGDASLMVDESLTDRRQMLAMPPVMEAAEPLMHAALPAPSSNVSTTVLTGGADDLLAGLKVGEALTAELLAQIQRLVNERR